ncbi:MAG: amidohydrolase family protein [Pyrinomonadaceae bacterium]
MRPVNFKLRAMFPKTVLCALFLTLMSAGSATAQSDGAQQNRTGRGGTFAIVGARVVTVSGGVIENGTVVIADGKIAAVGAGAAVPAGAERIDGKGLSVFPGMIDAATGLGLAEIGQGANATVDIAEVGTNNANAKAITGINPHSSHVNVTRVNGITAVLSYPTGGTIAGQAALIDLNGSTQAEMAVVPAAALVVNFPRISRGGGRFGGGGAQTSFTELVKRRDQGIEDLKKIFTQAANHARAVEAYASDKKLPAPRTDLALEALRPYIRGERPILFTAEREEDIRAVAKFVGEMKVKGIVVGGQEAWKAADVLKANNIAVIYTNIYSLPVREDDPFDFLYAAPGKMKEAGIAFAISTGDQGAEARDLPYHAGIAAAHGLSREDALRAVTLYPAQILGVADRMGSLDPGKLANVVVTDGDLLDPRTNVKFMFIAGRMIPLTSRHTDLFESFKDRKMPSGPAQDRRP